MASAGAIPLAKFCGVFLHEQSRASRPEGDLAGTAMTLLTWQKYREQFIRVRLRNFPASKASGKELIQQLRAIAADYKRVLFKDNSSNT
jgi:hypothetical protein